MHALPSVHCVAMFNISGPLALMPRGWMLQQDMAIEGVHFLSLSRDKALNSLLGSPKKYSRY